MLIGMSSATSQDGVTEPAEEPDGQETETQVDDLFAPWAATHQPRSSGPSVSASSVGAYHHYDCDLFLRLTASLHVSRNNGAAPPSFKANTVEAQLTRKPLRGLHPPAAPAPTAGRRRQATMGVPALLWGPEAPGDHSEA